VCADGEKTTEKGLTQMKTNKSYHLQWPLKNDAPGDAEAIVGIYPNKAKGMVAENQRRSTWRSTWGMNIAGPFCFLKNNSTDALASQVSNLTASHVVVKTKRKVVFINVVVSQGEEDLLISNEYRRQIKQHSHSGIAA
jgi:hypothetical protein